MPDNSAKANVPDEPGHAARGRVISYNARLGLILFAIYLALYAGFVALNAFDPERMGKPFLAGVNLAVIYGMVLIVAAFVLALIYMFLCLHHHEPTQEDAA